MKFFKLATATFLAGNAVVAAYEVPSDNLIAELADEYDAELSNFFDEAKCKSEGEGIEQCVKEQLGKGNIDTAWASSLEQAAATAEPCVVEAVTEKDIDKVVKCALPLLDITDKYCSTAAFREACGMSPSMFEDFVLDLAEVLEVVAVWEDEEDMEFFDEGKCESEGEGIEQCVKDEVGKGNIDTAWASSLEQALLTAEPCIQQAVIEKDVDKVVKCALPVLDILDKYCSTAAFREACGMTPSMFADFVLDLAEVLEVGEGGYGLRGSSFGEE